MIRWLRSGSPARKMGQKDNTSFDSSIIFMTGLSIFISIMILLPAFLTSSKMSGLQREGSSTNGIVEHLYIRQKKNDPPYFADYGFQAVTEQGSLHLQHGASVLRPEDFSNLSVGAPVKVIYRKLQPSVSSLQLTLQTVWLKPWDHFRKACVMTLPIAGIALVLGFGLKRFVVEGRHW